MYDFCPLCMEKGLKRKTKAYQVTLDEAVWSCEERGCIWPFGFEEPVYLQRVAGKTWSCYWDDSKSSASNRKDIVPISTDLPILSSSDSELEDNDLQECPINNVQPTENVTNNINTEDRYEKLTQPCMNNFEQINNYCNNISGSKLHNNSKPFAVQTMKDSASKSLKCHQETGNINENGRNIKSSIKQSNKTHPNNRNKMCESMRSASLCKSTVSSTCGDKTLNNNERVTNSKQCIPQLKKVCSNSHKQKHDSIKQAVPCQSNQSSIYDKKMCNINNPTIHNKHSTKQPKQLCSNNQIQKCDTVKKAVICLNDISSNLDQNTSDHFKEPVIYNEHGIKQTKKICLNSKNQNHDSRQQVIPCETIMFDAPNSIADTKVLNISSSSDSDTANSKVLHCDTEKRMHRKYNNIGVDVSQEKISVGGTLEEKNTGKMNQEIPSNLNNLLEPHQNSNNTNPENIADTIVLNISSSSDSDTANSKVLHCDADKCTHRKYNNVCVDVSQEKISVGGALEEKNMGKMNQEIPSNFSNLLEPHHDNNTNPENIADSIVLNLSSSSDSDTSNSKDLHCNAEKRMHREYNNVSVDIGHRTISVGGTLTEKNTGKMNQDVPSNLSNLLEPHQDNNTNPEKKSHLTSTTFSNSLVPQIKPSKDIKMESGIQLQVQNVQNYQNSTDTLLTNSKLEQNTMTAGKLEGLQPITLSYDASILNTLSARETDSSKTSKDIIMESGNELEVQNVQNYQNSTDTLLTNSKLEQNTMMAGKLEGLPPITLSYDASILNTLSARETDSSKTSKNIKMESGNQLEIQNVQNYQNSTDTLLTNSKLEQNTITTVKLEGLPPITLSYDASILNTLSAPETDSSKSMKSTGTNICVQPRLRSTQLSKRSSAECKKYKKFSFNAIMNRMKGQQANKVESINTLNPSSIRNADASLAVKNESKEKDLTISTEQNSKGQTKSIVSLDISSIPNTSTASCDNSVLSANTSIDSFLDDFLRNNYSMSEEISDDWLNALLV